MSAPIYIVIPEVGNLGATQYVLPHEIRRIVQHEEVCSVMFHENGKVYKINPLLTASEIHERLKEITEAQDDSLWGLTLRPTDGDMDNT